MFSSPFNPEIGFSGSTLKEDEEFLTQNLHPLELELVNNIKNKERRIEFANGRLCARHAMAQIGVPSDGSYVLKKNREPLWPEGICGSISHSHKLVAACAASKKNTLSVGLDIEYKQRHFDEAVYLKVLSNNEFLALSSHPDHKKLDFLRIFSAKECIFKLLYPIIRQQLYFKDAEVTYLPEHKKMQAKILNGKYYPQILEIGWLENSDYILTYSYLKK